MIFNYSLIFNLKDGKRSCPKSDSKTEKTWIEVWVKENVVLWLEFSVTAGFPERIRFWKTK